MALICLDTNAWFKEALLHSSVGSALLYFANTQRHTLLLPDVIRRELENLVVRTSRRTIDEAEESLRKVNELLGTQSFPVSISNEAIRAAYRRRLHDLSEVLKSSTTSDRAKAAAFDRVLDLRLPNSEKNQQAKDSLIWEHLLDLPEGTVLQFVTSDSMFFEGARGDSRFLAQELAIEASNRKIDIKIFRDCSGLLAASNPDPPNIDLDRLRSVLEPRISSIVKQALEKVSLAPRIISGTTFHTALFLTQDPNLLAVVLEIHTTVETELEAARVHIEARGRLDTRKYEVSDFQIFRVDSPGRSMMSGDYSRRWLGELGQPVPAPELLLPFDRVRAGLKRD